MKIANGSRIFFAVVTASVLSGCPKDYNEIVGKKVKASLGADFANHQIISYPTNNFGVGTLSRSSDNLQLCDMWNCLGVKDVPSDFNQWKKLDGKVGVGDNGALITLNETESRNYTIGAVLPKIAGVMNLGASLDDKSVVKTELQLGRAYPRYLRVPEWQAYMQGIKPDNMLGTAFRDGNLTVIVSDVVIESMKAKVTVDSTTGGKIDAALSAPVGVSKILNDGAKLELKATKEQEGVYTFEITQPVIVLRLAKKQPGGGVLGADNTYKTWGEASLPDNSK